MRDGREGRGNLGSLLISVAVHLAILILIPYTEPPVIDYIPLDVPGVVEIATIEGKPAVAAVPDGVDVRELPAEKLGPKATAPRTAPDPKSEPAKPVQAKAAEPKKPSAEPSLETSEPRQATPPPDRTPEPTPQIPDVLTGASSNYVAPPPTPPEAKMAAKPGPEPRPSTDVTTVPKAPEGSDKSGDAPGSGTAKVDAAVHPAPPSPDYPAGDATGAAMIISTGGPQDHGVWIPKSVANIRGQGEAVVRIRVKADGSVDQVVFLKRPSNSEMESYILKAVNSWSFREDNTPGRADAYYLDVRVGYDGWTGDVMVKSERASYQPQG
ncbi:MAG: hypothetical protein VB144_04165 [Clostridia bacterium]|nr:hypothetical protein [Clostridia bacterium]